MPISRPPTTFPGDHGEFLVGSVFLTVTRHHHLSAPLEFTKANYMQYNF